MKLTEEQLAGIRVVGIIVIVVLFVLFLNR